MPPYAFRDKREFERAARAVRAVERMEPRPKKGRRARRGGGGEVSVSSQLKWGRVYTEISKATEFATWGAGHVLFDIDADTIEVANPYPEVFVVGAVVCCDFAFSPPRVVGGSCNTIPDPEQEEE